jgi:hypothetical protein
VSDIILIYIDVCCLVFCCIYALFILCLPLRICD